MRVQEGLCIHVPCSFSYLWSLWSSSIKLYSSWYQLGNNTGYADPVATANLNKAAKRETQGQFLLGDCMTNICSLSIRDARKSDAGIYFFQVVRGRNVQYTYQDKKLNLQVTGMAGA